jgi:hypothetical protein
VGPRAGWTGVKNLVPTGIRFPDRSARSELLYQLRHPGPHPKTPTREKIYRPEKVGSGSAVQLLLNCPFLDRWEGVWNFVLTLKTHFSVQFVVSSWLNSYDISMISGCHREVDKNCALLRCYAPSSTFVSRFGRIYRPHLQG